MSETFAPLSRSERVHVTETAKRIHAIESEIAELANRVLDLRMERDRLSEGFREWVSWLVADGPADDPEGQALQEEAIVLYDETRAALKGVEI